MSGFIGFQAPPPPARPPTLAYQVISGSRTWSEAAAACEAIGHQLALVRNADDQAALSAALTSSAGFFVWIGASDSMNEGQWRWRDGSAVGFTDWGTGQPGDIGNEDCVVLFREAGVWRWYDTGCEFQYSHACSPLSPPLPPLSPLPPLIPAPFDGSSFRSCSLFRLTGADSAVFALIYALISAMWSLVIHMARIPWCRHSSLPRLTGAAFA